MNVPQEPLDWKMYEKIFPHILIFENERVKIV